MRDSIPVIAIDGPAASGKGTLTAELCRHLGWYRLDSGLLYRIVGFVLHENKVNLEDTVAVQDFLLDFLTIDIAWDKLGGQNSNSLVSVTVTIDGNERIFVSGIDVTKAIRSNEIAVFASRVAMMETVRAFLVPIQRSFRHSPGLVADGRDLGTVVFPDARVKIFLTATLASRALRRQKQLSLHGEANLRELEKSLLHRDHQDTNRDLAPLKPALDAIHIDCSELSIEDMTERALTICRDHSIC